MGCSKKTGKDQRVRHPEVPELSGWIIEDVWINKKEHYEKWEPHIQAIKHERGDLSLRFCYYRRNPDGSRGTFVRSPMWVYEWTIKDLVKEAQKHEARIILMLLKNFEV